MLFGFRTSQTGKAFWVLAHLAFCPSRPSGPPGLEFFMTETFAAVYILNNFPKSYGDCANGVVMHK